MSGSWTPWSDPSTPNLPDFRLFVLQNMGLSTSLVPSDSVWPQYALGRALGLVLSPPPSMAGIEYTLAVYNCAGHILLTITPQQASPFFSNVRSKLGLLSPDFGVVQSASDQGTSDVLAVPDAIKQLTLGDLQFSQTPWGRAYLAYNQDYGGIFGIT